LEDNYTRGDIHGITLVGSLGVLPRRRQTPLPSDIADKKADSPYEVQRIVASVILVSTTSSGTNPNARLSVDPLWPRAGAWPSPTGGDSGIDIALIGIPASQTSLSPTNAHLTPLAIREALRRYSPALMPSPWQDITDLAPLVYADFGDVDEPDSSEGEARSAALVRRASDAAKRAASRS